MTCKDLQNVDFQDVQDAPTELMTAQQIEATADVPAHCLVDGYILPQVGFGMKLPLSGWNGKFLMMGCGGLCGTLRIGLTSCDDGLRRGYACATTDLGHSSTGNPASKRIAADRIWAYNNLQAEVDHGFRAVHVATLAAKAITTRFYSGSPKHSYFMGCSDGGREALSQAQDFPWNYDGIISIDPAANISKSNFTHHMAWLAISKNGQSLFSPSDVDFIADSVMRACDPVDGLKDGVIDDPRMCKFDPGALQCRPDKTGKAGKCLTAEQVAAARKLYAGPRTASGEQIYYGPVLGGEKGDNAFNSTGRFADVFRYTAFSPDPGPTWTQNDFDINTDYKRLGVMGKLWNAANPDLRAFKGAGGKLIMAQGWDNGGSSNTLANVDYYEMVERVMNGRAATQDFARLFMMPGRDHCGRGPGANAIDFLSYLESWVEKKQAPDMMLASHLDPATAARSDYTQAPTDPAKVGFTRPLYPYPLRAKYKGKGDPNDYRNFGPVEANTK
ncbi:tannase/feruloyl esterase family alpha/beta hydrolase [Sphingobium sp. H39-3-25]|uniref:tannase/feruloyl esterase family alpha/beta hydrolase n=1 Tax=Sphingobium arseniciresistens TaxID=3030834 RepID=UPI0023B9CF41|nr:tannase/feruloyl esterase family alpha/beta hydrolase [Sphingobium arseniciresistens]